MKVLDKAEQLRPSMPDVYRTEQQKTRLETAYNALLEELDLYDTGNNEDVKKMCKNAVDFVLDRIKEINPLPDPTVEQKVTAFPNIHFHDLIFCHKLLF